MFKDLAKAIQDFAKAWADIESRKLDLLQQELEITKNPNPSKPRDVIPHYVWMLCNSESEQWAREDAMKQAHEMYDELGDWEKVAERLSLKV